VEDQHRIIEADARIEDHNGRGIGEKGEEGRQIDDIKPPVPSPGPRLLGNGAPKSPAID